MYMYMYICIYIYVIYTYNYMCVCVCVGLRTPCGLWGSPFTMWVLGLQLMSFGLVARPFAYRSCLASPAYLFLTHFVVFG